MTDCKQVQVELTLLSTFHEFNILSFFLGLGKIGTNIKRPLCWHLGLTSYLQLHEAVIVGVIVDSIENDRRSSGEKSLDLSIREGFFVRPRSFIQPSIKFKSPALK